MGQREKAGKATGSAGLIWAGSHRESWSMNGTAGFSDLEARGQPMVLCTRQSLPVGRPMWGCGEHLWTRWQFSRGRCPSSQYSQLLENAVPLLEGPWQGAIGMYYKQVTLEAQTSLTGSATPGKPHSLPYPSPSLPLILLDLLLCHPPAPAGLALAWASGSCLRPSAIPVGAEGSRKCPTVVSSSLDLLPASPTLGPASEGIPSDMIRKAGQGTALSQAWGLVNEEKG